MSSNISYLVRKLTIIRIDGQFSEYHLVYVRGERTQQGLENISISVFDREYSRTAFIDSLSIQEVKPGKWIIV